MPDSQHFHLLSLKILAASPHKDFCMCCGKMREVHLSTTHTKESERRRREQAATMKIRQSLKKKYTKTEQRRM